MTIRLRLSDLWHNGDFVKLWTGETVSAFGSQVTSLALPLVAVATLNASPFQMGVLATMTTLPILVLGLPAGVWVDRRRRRPLLLATNIGRCIVLGVVPASRLLGHLAMPLLYGAAFATGVLGLVFDTAYQSYLPSLVPRESLVEGNSKFEASRSAAQVLGPTTAGLLETALTAPIAIAFDAASFLVSAVCVGLIRTPEPANATSRQRHLLHEVVDGLRFVASHRLLRTLVGVTCVGNLWSGALFSQQILFLKHVLGLSPAEIGFLLSVGGPGALVGVLITNRLTYQLGVGRTIILGSILFTTGDYCLGLARGPLPIVIALVAAFQALVGLGSPLYNINVISLRQTLTPDHLLGRVVASARMVAVGSLPVGALLGGALSEVIGPRALLLAAASGMLIPLTWLLVSPIRVLRAPPVAQ